MESNKSVFEVLSAIKVGEHVEKKDCGNGRELSYLSWAWAWHYAKSFFPDASFTVYENRDGWNYFTDGRTCWVKTGVTIQGQEHIEYLPVMDYKNKSIPAGQVTSFDVNKAIQRSLTKALARHGLGLSIYAGEDLPNAADDRDREEVNKNIEKFNAESNPFEPLPYQPMSPDRYKQYIAAEATGQRTKTGRTMKQAWASATHAGQDQLDLFDYDVDQYKRENGIA